MPKDPRRRQKKQERHAARRKAKQRHLARQKHAGLPERLTSAARYPVLDSMATTDLWDQGLGWVCLSRELPNGFIAYAVFLVDRYCLGVKDALADITGRFTYDSEIVRKMRSHFQSKDLSPADVRKLVEGAVEYARGLGLQPHPDYHRVKHIFGDIDAGESTAEFEFGKDGKPFFVAGPNDTPERCRQIMRTLEQRCGPDGYHFLMPISPTSKILAESPDEAGVIGFDEDADGEQEDDFSVDEDRDEKD